VAQLVKKNSIKKYIINQYIINKQRLKKALRRLDTFSPWPISCSFVMSNDEKVRFDLEIKHSKHYLEFGMGGSTLRAIRKSKAKIYTVESSPEWIADMREYRVVTCFENKRLFINSVDIGQTRLWGYPESKHSRNLYPSYSSDVFNVIDPSQIDLALVDGRFRVACTLKIILECHQNSNLRIFIHDFWNRQEYHIVLKYLDTLEAIDTLGIFSIKTDLDLKLVRADYESYQFNPD